MADYLLEPNTLARMSPDSSWGFRIMEDYALMSELVVYLTILQPEKRIMICRTASKIINYLQNGDSSGRRKVRAERCLSKKIAQLKEVRRLVLHGRTEVRMHHLSFI